MEVKKIICIIQARSASSRLPNKVLLQINKNSILDIVIKRLKKSKKVDQIIVSTTKNKSDDKIVDIAKLNNVDFYRGDNKNVLKRFYNTARNFKADTVIRITADCPFVDYRILDLMIDFYKKNNYEYISNAIKPTYPDGLDIAIFSYKILQKANLLARDQYDKEHVTSIMRSKNFCNFYNYSNSKNLSNFRLCLDEFKDYELIKYIFKQKKDIFFKWQDAVKIIKQNKEIYKMNSDIERNEGAYIDNQKKLWIRSKNIIPGGNMMLTKRPENILKSNWPAFFTKAEGCFIWDYNKKKYLDFYLMGVGTNILGYNNKIINSAVKKKIDKGNISSLNNIEELLLAEKLKKIDPWAECVQFARTGGDANSIAIRIARAYTKSSKIAICGYHGWHDWYLSANLNKKNNLNQHLFSGLDISGVPKELKKTVFPFMYNDFDYLKKIVKKYAIKIIKMEVIRREAPKNNFLKKIRSFCNKNNIILIFDECTSGFRETLGGYYKKFSVIPDILIYGKAIGNGFPITTVLSKRKFFNVASKTFISSTFWSEGVGPTAALKTIELMERKKSWILISQTGKHLKKRIKKLFVKHKIDGVIKGIDAIIKIEFKTNNKVKIKYISQEMLKKNILAGPNIFVSIAHKNNHIKKYLNALDVILYKIKKHNDRLINYIDKRDLDDTEIKRFN